MLGIGEIGLNKNTRNELTIFREQMEMAIKHGQLVLIHTPHLRDKLKGTKLTLDLLRELRCRAGAGLDRPCGGAHDQGRARRRLLGGLDAVSHDQDDPEARGGHAGACMAPAG